MPAGNNNYGLQQKKKKASARLSLTLAALAVFWGLAVMGWTTQRLAVLFGYQSGLGAPLFEAVGRLWYWPWKCLEWWGKVSAYPEAAKIFDQAWLVLAGGPLLAGALYVVCSQKPKGRADLHGSARWADYGDIEGMGYLKGRGVYVGGFWQAKKRKHYYLRHDGPEHVLCFAPTRSGKGIGLILPTLLSYDQSTLVMDIKGENYALTSGYLKSKGHKVIRFDPSDSSGASAAFNPLAEIRLDTPEAISDTQNLAAMVMDPAGQGMDDYWSKAAFGFFGGAVLHCLIKTWSEADRAATLHDLALMLENPERPVKNLFDEMLEMDHIAALKKLYPHMDSDLAEAAHTFIASAAQGMLSKADNELSGVVNTATANLALYKNPVVALNTSRCDFRIMDLMNHETPVNLYVVIPPGSINTLRPLLRLFMAQVTGRLIERMKFENGANAALYKWKLLLMLDEFTALGKLPVMEKGVAYFAGYNIKLYIIVQDTKQFNGVYGQDNAFMANCQVKIVYTPNVPETAEMISKMLGTTTVVDKKVSVSSGGKGGGSKSSSVSETSRPLLTPDECMRLPGLRKDERGRPVPGDMLILTSGNPPIYGRQTPYFLDPVFSARAKIKAPGVEDGWEAGLSDSLYHPMPLKGTSKKAGRLEAPLDAQTAPAALEEASVADEMAEYEHFFQEAR